jgi:hypothetical protein
MQHRQQVAARFVGHIRICRDNGVQLLHRNDLLAHPVVSNTHEFSDRPTALADRVQ